MEASPRYSALRLLGKTTLALNIIAQAQKMGGLVLYIDAEHALDTAYASICGVNVNSLKGAQPGTGEEALDIAERMVRTHALDVVVIDSVAALVPRAEIEGEMGESHVGLAGQADVTGPAKTDGRDQ